ncbi:hypothetical protein AAGQ42_26730, partial [Klebsiella pneumoniae]
IGPDPRNFNQRVSLGRNDLLIRTFLIKGMEYAFALILKISVSFPLYSAETNHPVERRYHIACHSEPWRSGSNLKVWCKKCL